MKGIYFVLWLEDISKRYHIVKLCYYTTVWLKDEPFASHNNIIFIFTVDF